MRAESDDQLHIVERRASKRPIIIGSALLLCGLAIYWYWAGDRQTSSDSVATPPASLSAPKIARPAVPATPDIPRREVPPAPPITAPQQTAADNTPAQEEPVTPQDPDTAMREQLEATGVVNVLPRLGKHDQPLQLTAALLDGLGHGAILRKILPADPLPQPFSVSQEDGRIFMNPAGYKRYDRLVASIDAMDTAALASGFHLMRPFFERAYTELGMDSADLDNAIIRALDLILATPEIDAAIELRRDSVLYQYAEPQLEELSDLQKQLLRMGPDNLRAVKRQAQRLRDRLLAG